MAKSPPPIVFILGIALLGGGGWFAFRSGLFGGGLSTPNASPDQAQTAQTTSQTTSQTTAAQPQAGVAQLDTSLPNPAAITMDGSVTMVAFVQQLRTAFNQQNPNVPVTYGIPANSPNGSSAGLEAVMNGQAQMAATSRPLRAEEAQAGIVAVPVAKDALAVVVGATNPFKGGLTLQQLREIFNGNLTNWSEVGGPNAPLRVINRPPASGSHSLFQDIVLLGQPYASDGPNFVTWPRDETTAILRELGDNGISYTTVAQAENQSTIRIVQIDGVSPTDRSAVQSGTYSLSRNVFLAAPSTTSPAVQEFINLAVSPRGQEIAASTGFIPLQ